MKKILFLIAILASVTFNAQQINVSTGVDNLGASLGHFTTDPSWTVSNTSTIPVPIPATIIPTYPFNWTQTPISGTNAQWIHYQNDYWSVPGDYIFERVLDIPLGTTSLQCNFGVAHDDGLVSLELLSPSGEATVLPVIFVNTGDNYQISPLITNSISNPTPGLWKIRAIVNYFDPVGGFMLSGYVTIVTPLGVTNVQNSQCGTTLPFYNSIVYANAVPNAQMYRFKVTNLGTNQVVTQDYILRNLFMHTLSNFEYSQIYKIEVAVKRNNVWEAYGAPCSITTASAFTKVIASQCGTSLTSRNTIISADNVNLAQGYRFKVTNLTTSSVQYIDRTTRTFNFNAVTDYALGTTYQIEVAVKNTNGQYLPYGAACTVTTPFTKVQHENTTKGEIQATSIQTQAYPNPYVNGFTVSVATPSKSEISLTIYDMLGNQMESRIVPVDALESLELGNQLGSGVYTVVLVQDDNRVAFKMVKR